MWDNDIFMKALHFAFEAHDRQYLTYPSSVPYSAHLTGVLSFAVKYSFKEKTVDWNFLVPVALLHDVLEDTDVKYDQLKNSFGDRVANAVFALTKNKTLEKTLQMKESLEKILKQPKEVAMVKMADRIFNLQGRVPTWSKEKQEAYKKEAILIHKTLGFASKSFSEALEKSIENN